MSDINKMYIYLCCTIHLRIPCPFTKKIYSVYGIWYLLFGINYSVDILFIFLIMSVSLDSFKGSPITKKILPPQPKDQEMIRHNAACLAHSSVWLIPCLCFLQGIQQSWKSSLPNNGGSFALFSYILLWVSQANSFSPNWLLFGNTNIHFVKKNWHISYI